MKTSRATPNQVNNTGFTSISNTEGARLTNADGSLNMRKTGLPPWELISIYHTLIHMNRRRFFLFIFLFYTVVNILFAFGYVLIGVEHLEGVSNTGSDSMSGFLQAFFFSSQTLTTVGYGHISPIGIAANSLAAAESFLGILSFALVTGLLYGRFTRPKAYLIFSQQAVITMHKGFRAIMFRFASSKNNHLTDVEVQLSLAFHVRENDKLTTKFFSLKPEMSKINSLALSWTIVHVMNEESPFWGMSWAEMQNVQFELLVFIKGFDDHFSNQVQQRTSYTVNDVIYGAKFLPTFRRSDDGKTTILELDKINQYEVVPLVEELTAIE
ncbi:MAG: Inward rectifier potassium channel Irk [Bacteroidetes bacterium]|nr:Inward rectifier potassium channel Irk [Bacteroidota bacterium]